MHTVPDSAGAPCYVGVDVAKAHLDVAWPVPEQAPAPQACAKATRAYAQHRFDNDALGQAALLARLPAGAHLVMEASGPYYLGLALLAHAAGCPVSVVNPLVVKHFARMRMRRAKTDAADARLLADFGADQTPDPWQPPQEHLFHLQQLQATLHHYVGERTRITNQREAFRHTGHLHPRVKASLGRLHRQVEKEIQRLEKELDGLLRAHYGDLVDRLTTIPGLGAKTSLQLILISDGFTRFQQVKQLVAYVGLAPRLSQSGTRTQGRAPICKLGAGRIRACLYMAALSALRRNPACKALYERLRRAGKTHKMARVAVAHKLVRQAFAVATGGGGYEVSRALPLTS